ncbi:metallophosphoesterase family protein [Asaia krungthepensis]|uniref:Exonuclease n=1 Tax=Asaia krungthepensis NRIC 0535 TaxID=1307925 RepID=A0ABQ0PWL6_9PROT|nr:DNA repair exonuclease [Asaia krungthepensis]GBQ83383.1 exonuclease [Asaia krungthepensis NRIC 0535]
MSSFRFIHAADLHLDSPLRGLERHDGLSMERIRDASRRALDRMVDAAIAHDVAFVVIAGDLYDGNWKTVSTGRYMANALGRLIRHGIGVYLLQGNHDAASILTRDLPLPQGVQRFPSRKPGSFTIEPLGVALHGQSFAERHVPDDMTPSYPKPMEGYFNIGVLHTSLSGHGQHEVYAPCSVQGLRARGYDYWALGHVHERMIDKDGTPIVYPGVLQGRHIHETGEKGVVLVTVDNRTVTSIDPLPCDVVRWRTLHFDCTGMTQEAELHQRLGAEFVRLAEAHPDHLCVTRLILEGKTTLHDLLRRQGIALRETVQHLAAMSGGEIELEKLQIQTRAQEQAGENEASPGMATDSALAGLIQEATRDPALLAEIGAELDLCLRTLNLGDVQPGSLLDRIDQRAWETILPALGESLCDRLASGGDTP